MADKSGMVCVCVWCVCVCVCVVRLHAAFIGLNDGSLDRIAIFGSDGELGAASLICTRAFISIKYSELR